MTRQKAKEDEAKRQSIAARIRALLAMTLENGASENEAVFAAKKAAELLEEYDLSMDEVEMRASPFSGSEQAHTESDVGPRFYTVANAISELTGTENWTSRPGIHPVVYSFFGMAHEVAIAEYLLAICARAIRSECAVHEKEWAFYRPAFRRSKRISFLDGMADSLSRRIRALKPRTKSGSGLVVLHNALIDEELARRGISLSTKRKPGSWDFDSNYVKGLAAGERVALDPGIETAQRPSGAIANQARDAS